MKDIVSAKIHKKIFWTAVAVSFTAAVGGIFWLNYSFDRETRAVFADMSAGAAHPAHTAIGTSSWKTYENKKFGFSFKYPPELQTFPCVGKMLFCLNVGEKNFAFQNNGFAVRIYSLAGLKSSEEEKFVTKKINGISWRVNRDTIQYFRTEYPVRNELRIFAGKSFGALSGVLSSFQIVH